MYYSLSIDHPPEQKYDTGEFPIKIGTQRSLLSKLDIFMVKIANLFVIRKLIWDSISIGNPPSATRLECSAIKHVEVQTPKFT